MMEKLTTFIAVAVLAIAAAGLLAMVLSLPVMWLWNAVVPDVFGLPTLSWTQAIWLALLCTLLFKASAK